jgi:hypothetical protein
MKIGASLVLLVAPTVIACAAAVPVGAGRAYKTAHATSPNDAFCKHNSSPAIECPQFMNIRMHEQLRGRARTAASCSCAFGASPNRPSRQGSKH